MSTDVEKTRQNLIRKINDLKAIIENASKEKSRTNFSDGTIYTQKVSKSGTQSPENQSNSFRSNNKEPNSKGPGECKEIREVPLNIQNQKFKCMRNPVSSKNGQRESFRDKDLHCIEASEQKTEKEALKNRLKETEENIKKLKMCIAEKRAVQKEKIKILDSKCVSKIVVDNNMHKGKLPSNKNGPSKIEFKSATPISDLISSNMQRLGKRESTLDSVDDRDYSNPESSKVQHVYKPHWQQSKPQWKQTNTQWQQPKPHWQQPKPHWQQPKPHWQKPETQWQQTNVQWQSTSSLKVKSVTPISDLITKNLQQQTGKQFDQKQSFIKSYPAERHDLSDKELFKTKTRASYKKSPKRLTIKTITPISDQISRNLAKKTSLKYPKFPQDKKWSKKSASVRSSSISSSQYSWNLKPKPDSQYRWQSKSQKAANVIKSKYKISYSINKNNFWKSKPAHNPGNVWKNYLGFHKARSKHEKYSTRFNYTTWKSGATAWMGYRHKSKINSSTRKSRYQLDKRVKVPLVRTGQVTRAMASVLQGQCLVMIDGRVYRTSQSQLAGGHTSSPGQAKKVSATRRSLSLAPFANRKWKSQFLTKSANSPVANARILASRVLQRSIHTVATKSKKKRAEQYCMFYNRFGKCNRGDKCKYRHDPEKVAVCTRFLRGTCSIVDCPFSHKVDKEKMPVCSYFLRGVCSRENCPYLHVKVNKNAEVCQDFLQGFCSKGAKCTKSHTLVCQMFAANGYCPDGAKCKLQHRKQKTRKRKSEAIASSSVVEELQDEQEPDSENLTVPVKAKKLPAFISINKPTRGDQNVDASMQMTIENSGQTKKLKIKPEFLS